MGPIGHTEAFPVGTAGIGPRLDVGLRWATLRSGKPMKERRKTERIPDDFPGLLTRSLYDSDIRAVRIRDLGDGGACAVADFEPSVGTEYYAGFFLVSLRGIPIIARVRVAWTRQEGFEHAIGLEFLYDGQAQLDSVIRIRDYLAMRRRETVATD